MHHWEENRSPAGRRLVVIAVLLLISRRGGETEIERVARLLDLQAGDTVADVGAGDGWLSVEVARVIGDDVDVFATELSARRRADIRPSVAVAGLANVTVVEAGEHEANLPLGCCAAIFKRRVYHHLTDPAAYNASSYALLKPGGRLAIVELDSTAFCARSVGGRTGPTTSRSWRRSPRRG